jgi:uncharacterized protein (DUF1800 family)
MALTLAPETAWSRLPDSQWNQDAARHLLRRAGWTALPGDVERATKEGLSATLDRLFPDTVPVFNQPRQTAHMVTEAEELQEKVQAANEEDKRLLYREFQQKSRNAIVDMTIHWMRYAARPDSAVFAKWILFLSDIYVVGYEKVQRAPMIYKHFDIISRYAFAPAPLLTKAISRSPAMIQYLDLNQSQKKAPNENFARELFELFTLGEGNYTEKDIKEAARAFTGYRLRKGSELYYQPNQHDTGLKTIFGETGNFNGDDVIRLTYKQRAAGAFVPHEMVKFYLSDTMIDNSYLYSLGDQWRTQGYSLQWLAKTFFGSTLFFDPSFRGEFIKSPIQYYLGLVQDLNLDIIPVPRLVINPLRQMGQVLFDPPNVRGWVGGRNWINSSSLAARRSLAESLFAPFYEAGLNEDEKLDVAAARAQGRGIFTVENSRFQGILSLSPEEITQKLTTGLLAQSTSPALKETITNYIASAENVPGERLRRVKRSMVSLISSPQYQLT